MPRLLAVAVVMCATRAAAAPAPELWERWAKSDGRSKLVVDHGAFDAWLGRYVVRRSDNLTLVRYGAVTPADRAALSRYVDTLEAFGPSRLKRREQLAYWVNLYNAATLELVLAHYPVASIRDVQAPWDQKLLTIEGEAVSLNDIEHRILRPIFKDARLHYALNCASIGCPNLQERAFRGATVQGRLDALARGYLIHPRGLAIEGGKLVVSSLFHWYGADFGASEADIIAHLSAYVPPEQQKLLAGRAHFDAHRYDWRLNDAEPPATGK